jgi:hypothetical protein
VFVIEVRQSVKGSKIPSLSSLQSSNVLKSIKY